MCRSSSSLLINNFFRLIRLLFIDFENEFLCLCKLLLLEVSSSSLSYSVFPFSPVPDQADELVVLPSVFLPFRVFGTIVESTAPLLLLRTLSSVIFTYGFGCHEEVNGSFNITSYKRLFKNHK